MTDPKYRPRDAAVTPGKFGSKSFDGWRPAAELAAEVWPGLADPAGVRARLRAAQIQHQYCIRIRMALKERGMKLSTYADHAGVGYDRMTKVLRGEALLRLEDLAMADVLLGPISEFARAAAERVEKSARPATDLRR